MPSTPTTPATPEVAEGGAGTVGAMPTAPADAACNPKDYTLAVRLSLGVSWPGTLGVEAGTDSIHFWGRLHIVERDGALVAEHHYCGNQMPVSMTTPIGGAHRVYQEVPVATFDSTHFPSPAASVTSNADTTQLGMITVLLGLDLPDPLGTWPTQLEPSVRAVDAEGDGKPGLTSFPREGEGFALSPTSVLMTNFADQMYGAVRLAYTAAVAAAPCTDVVDGSATVSAFDQLVVGCHIKGGQDCSADEVRFFNDNRPMLMKAAATFNAKSLDTLAACSAVRDALPVPAR